MYAYGVVFLFIFIFIYLILEVKVPIHPLFSLADFIFINQRKKETETERLSLMHKLFRNAAVPIPFLHLLSFLLFCSFLLLLLLFFVLLFFWFNNNSPIPYDVCLSTFDVFRRNIYLLYMRITEITQSWM